LTKREALVYALALGALPFADQTVGFPPGEEKMRSSSLRRGGWAFALACALVSSARAQEASAADRAYVSASHLHRAHFDPADPRLAQLIEQGAVVRAEDYGSFAMAVIDDRVVGGARALLALELDLRDDHAVIGFNELAIDTADERTAAESLSQIPEDLRSSGELTRDLMIVQFSGPIRDEWLERLERTGARRVSYVAHNAYVVAVTPLVKAELEIMRADAAVQWIGYYHPFVRLSPDLRAPALRGDGQWSVTIQVIDGPEAWPIVGALTGGQFPIERETERVENLWNVRIALPGVFLAALAAHPSIFAIESRPLERLLDEVQGQVMAGNLNAGGTGPSGTGYFAWLGTKGFASAGQFGFIVDVVDDGIDRGSVSDVNVEFKVGGVAAGASRLMYNNNYTSDAIADGGGGHGNLNASIICGHNTLTGTAFEDAGGYNYGLGICPFVQVGNTKVFSNGSGSTFTAATSTRLNAAYAGGARISSNSWGYISGNSYNSDSQAHDVAVRDAQSGVGGNQELAIVFAAGNDGSAANTVRPPATAKNIICVGAEESNRQTGTDGCGTGNSGADNVRDVIGFSSRGPCSDLRKKPDIMAPGTHIEGAASRSLSYNGSGVCNQFWPVGQTLYAWSSGTSHSTPGIAGACALERQWFVNQGWGTPSPAMLKAALMTTTRYLTGVGANDALYSNNQGMGAVDMGRAFDGVATVRVDQTQILGATGATYTASGTISSSAQPFRVGLSYTDKSGPTTGNAWVNNLDLEVTVNGTLYRGNVFSGGTSITGGAADTRNNAEFVFLPAGTTGNWSITVRATNVAGDGVPGNADTTDQDFALYVYNGSAGAPSPDFTLSATPPSRSIVRGTSTTYSVTCTPSGGFAANVTLSATPAISGVTYAFAPNPVAAGGTSTLTVTTTATATLGTHTITISGTGGALTRTTTASLTINPSGGGGSVITRSAAPGLAIPDNNATGTTSTVNVATAGTVSSVSVSVNVTHTYIGDLEAALIGPTGTTVLLHNRGGGAADNIVTTYSILTAPAAALSAFNGTTTAGNWSLRVRDLAGADVGTLNSWTMTLNGEKSLTANLAIPDNNATGATSTINYTDTGLVAGVRVRVQVTHTWIGDLNLALIAPDNTTVVLHANSGGSADNIQTEYPDLTVPAQSLAAMTGRSIAGAWRLRAIDNAAADTGTMVSWTLSLSAQ
jgi:subtilisin-like proprotein convertase family protein